MKKLSDLIESFLLRVLCLELVWAVVHAPDFWERVRTPTPEHTALPPVLWVKQSVPSGWYVIAACADVGGASGVPTQVADLCLDGPYERLAQVYARAWGRGALKYRVWPLYINRQ